MGSVKDVLRQSIEKLTEKDARKTMEYVQRLGRRAGPAGVWDLLSENPTIRIPADGPGGFPPFRPIEGTGAPASRLLIEDRR